MEGWGLGQKTFLFSTILRIPQLEQFSQTINGQTAKKIEVFSH